METKILLNSKQINHNKGRNRMLGDISTVLNHLQNILVLTNWQRCIFTGDNIYLSILLLANELVRKIIQHSLPTDLGEGLL